MNALKMQRDTQCIFLPQKKTLNQAKLVLSAREVSNETIIYGSGSSHDFAHCLVKSKLSDKWNQHKQHTVETPSFGGGGGGGGGRLSPANGTTG